MALPPTKTRLLANNGHKGPDRSHPAKALADRGIVGRPKKLSAISWAFRLAAPALAIVGNARQSRSAASSLCAEALGHGGYQERRAGSAVLALIARGASTVDDRRRLVGDELPGTLLAHPDREEAIVDVHDGADHRDLGRHPAGHERSPIDD
jgi:hypothetical protein